MAEKDEIVNDDGVKENGHESGHGVAAPKYRETDFTDDALLDVGTTKLEDGSVSGLKLAKDGHTVLVPQPSDDPNDPLNWSWRKKHTMLALCSLSAFLADYGSACGVPTIVLQGVEWHKSPNKVNYAGNLNVIMLGIGGLLWIPVVSYWGRAPVMFWSVLAGTLCTLACTVTHNFLVFYGFRAMMGLTLTAYQAVGLSCIKDMFFFHEHARKIGIWVALFVLSPYMAPLLGNFIISGTNEWRPVFWMVFGTCCLDLVLIILFLDETFYDREIPKEAQPDRGSRLMRVIGLWQIRHHNYFRPVLRSYVRLLNTFLKPIIPLACLYYMMSFMWSVGINITSTILLQTPRIAGGYGFNNKGVGFLYFTPIVAVILGEGFGHFFNDYLANRYIRTHNGHFKPEARLSMNYISSLFMIPGLIVLGQALEQHFNYGVIIIGWGMYVFGVMTASVAVTAFALDCYPSASGEVAGLLNFARVIGGFTVGYFQEPWGAKDGYGASFGVQAAIVGIATILLAGIQYFGPKIRAKSGGQVHW